MIRVYTHRDGHGRAGLGGQSSILDRCLMSDRDGHGRAGRDGGAEEAGGRRRGCDRYRPGRTSAATLGGVSGWVRHTYSSGIKCVPLVKTASVERDSHLLNNPASHQT